VKSKVCFWVVAFVLAVLTGPHAASAAEPGDIWTDLVTGMEFVWVGPGCFQMGSPNAEASRDIDEGPVHEVCVDGFWMGKYEVTQGQWLRVMKHNLSRHRKGDDYPVEQVSWYDAWEFIRKYSRMPGAVHEFRLPTEAEWEYACRAGSVTPFFFGETITSDQANFDGNYIYGDGKKGENRRSTTPAGTFGPNAFGVCDMHGNVWEWCEDTYKENAYEGHPRDNPLYKGHGSCKVVRGGCWYGIPRTLRSAERNKYTPAYRDDILGFRLVRSD